MGAYYTPVPVVKYIVRQVDKLLREEFGITKGLASTDTIDHWIETGQDHRIDKRHKSKTGYTAKLPRVQILDPAVGTATFLNETIKHIYESFKGQEGRWESYVNDNLLKRLFGFELMMAPYTIAHLKLGMTLKETGVDKLNDRLGVYLTNTLEEGVPTQQDLFSFGLAEAISQESKLAARVKSERPVMVVMGNPPYSVSSNNKSEFIEKLAADYKKGLNERNIQPLSDDYIKFIRFAENMVSKNGSGIVAMITNNSYLDGIIHRQMRKHLVQTFNKIYILNLHGSLKKKEVVPDGSKDDNVFDIQQGVCIILAIKDGKKIPDQLGEVYYSEIYGKRAYKFDALSGDRSFEKVTYSEPRYYFVPKDFSGLEEYENGIKINELMHINTNGVKSHNDSELISFIPFETEYNQPIQYRPFDYRYIDYDTNKVVRHRYKVMKNMLNDNLGLMVKQGFSEDRSPAAFITESISDTRTWTRAGMMGAESIFPLYIYYEDGTRFTNFNKDELSKLTEKLTNKNYSPEDILDYVYAVLHSRKFLKKYNEFIKIDFPRVPKPTQKEFDSLVLLGCELRELHLMHARNLDKFITGYPEPGSDIVEKVNAEFPITVGEAGNEDNKKRLGRVYINDKQYFRNVPKIAWEFYIGGYQPAQKWLKDRKGRKLNNEDIEHYQKIIKVLTETDKIMREIDKVWHP